MKRHGFTLVEVLVVMVVIGILVALIVPNALQAIRIANERSCQNNVRTLNSAIQLHFADTRTWPADTDALCPYLDDSACSDPGVTGFQMLCPVDGATEYQFETGDDDDRLRSAIPCTHGGGAAGTTTPTPTT